MSFTTAQCRAARGLLGWSRAQLAEKSKVAVKTIADFEREARTPYDRTLADLRRAFESAGVLFVEENGDGPGVRVRKFKAGDIVRLTQAGRVSGIRVGKGQTGIVTSVELETESLGEKHCVTVKFGDILVPVGARDLELVQGHSESSVPVDNLNASNDE